MHQVQWILVTLGTLTLFLLIYFVSTTNIQCQCIPEYIQYREVNSELEVSMKKTVMGIIVEPTQTQSIGYKPSTSKMDNLKHSSGNRSTRPRIKPITSHEAKDVVPQVHRTTLKDVQLEDVYISVKTTVKNYRTRLKVILDTWYTLAEHFVYFFTDSSSPAPQPLGKNLVVTNCGKRHIPGDLMCKLEAELRFYYKLKTRWLCHFDDDNYVNIPVLLSTLSRFNHSKTLYLGRGSITVHHFSPKHNKTFHVQFATGGAGVCLSQGLMERLQPYIGNGLLRSTVWSWLRPYVPDDVGLGFVITHLLKVKLTEMENFHSHLRNNEKAASILLSDLHKQVTLGYKMKPNATEKLFQTKEDPTGLRHIHCYLFSKAKNCNKFKIKGLDDTRKLGELIPIL